MRWPIRNGLSVYTVVLITIYKQFFQKLPYSYMYVCLMVVSTFFNTRVIIVDNHGTFFRYTSYVL